MSGASQKPAFVRTGAPMGAGAVIVFIAKTLGLDITADQTLIILPVVMYLYYVLGRALESFNPKLGYVLGIAKQPAYSTESSPSPGPGEDVVAEVVPEQPEPEVDPQPVDEPVEEFVPEPEPEPIQPLIRSTPLDEVRAAARKAPAKKAPAKRAPRKAPPAL